MAKSIYTSKVEEAKELVDIFFLIDKIVYNCQDEKDFEVLSEHLNRYNIDNEIINCDDKLYIKTKFHVIDPSNKKSFIDKIENFNEDN